MKKFCDRKAGFEITFPDGWKKTGWLFDLGVRLIQPAGHWGYVFFGPNATRAVLRFAISPVRYKTDLENQKIDIQAELTYGKNIEMGDFGFIKADGKEYLTLIYGQEQFGKNVSSKNYYLRSNKFECLLTAVLSKTISGFGSATIIQKEYQSVYDQIVSTFRLLP